MNQSERFQAAWQAAWPNDSDSIFEQSKSGMYTWPSVQDTWEGFQLGEASGMERAAKVCDAAELQHLNARDIDDFYSPSSSCAAACESCALAIRALMAQGEI